MSKAMPKYHPHWRPAGGFVGRRKTKHAEGSDALSRPPRLRGALLRNSDPAIGVAVILLGCLLTFYLVGFLLIPLGAWLWRRALPA